MRYSLQSRVGGSLGTVSLSSPACVALAKYKNSISSTWPCRPSRMEDNDRPKIINHDNHESPRDKWMFCSSSPAAPTGWWLREKRSLILIMAPSTDQVVMDLSAKYLSLCEMCKARKRVSESAEYAHSRNPRPQSTATPPPPVLERAGYRTAWQ